MANTDNSNAGLTDLNPNHGGEELVCVLNPTGETSTVSNGLPPTPSDTTCVSSQPHSISPTNPSASLRSSIALANSSSPFPAPQSKKFSAVNINKKFLEKNSSSGSATTSSNHVPIIKSGSPTPVRPVPPPTTTHSRLVTTKLTAAPVSSTTTGPGWSRPSSATPSTPSTSSNPSPPHPPPSTNVSAPVSVPAAPQLPVVGKVIQPQPRAMVSTAFPAKKDNASKPAWGTPKVVAPVPFPESAGPSDFPTAAEVAHGRPSPKLPESQKPLDVPSSKIVTLEEADAFRGVHLDPNTHHWDEMEEDDDHFLDGVIEFGDGRQYKISPTEASVQKAPSPGPATDTLKSSEPYSETVDDSKTHVTKEDRFADDYDRRWPRSRPSPSIAHKDLSRAPRHPSLSPASSHPSYSPSEGSKVLFNERSNRLEPYSSHPYTRHLPGGPMARRNSPAEQGVPPVDTCIGRDGPFLSPAQPVQLLQKPLGGHDRSSRTLRGGPPPHGPFGRTRDRDGLPSSLNTRQTWNTGHPSSSDEKREPGPDGRSRRLSNMGPPPLPSSLKHDATRQLPPHISTGPPGRLFSRDPHPSASQQSPTSTTQGGSVVAQSPLLSAVSVTSENPASFSTPVLTLEDVHKTAMHISAERAKQRRQMEEEEREKEKERARQKAAALEAKLKMNEENKIAEDTEVVQFIQESVEAANLPSQPTPLPDTVARRPISIRQVGRPPSLRPSARPPLIPPTSNIEQSQVSSKIDSWRSKALRLSSPVPQETPVEPRVPPPLLHGVEEFVSASADEDLEVVDFSDLGKLVGAPTISPPQAQHNGIDRFSHPPRPVASDFFEDSQHQSIPPRPKSPSAWRRRAPIQLVRDVLAPPSLSNQEEVKEKPSQDTPAHPASPKSSHEKVVHIPASVEADLTVSSSSQATLPISPQRLNRPNMTFREAPMSALDDVISRIKGALDNMQATESARTEATKQANKETGDTSHDAEITKQNNANSRVYSNVPKWLPPALRPRRIDFDREEREVFDVTGCEPPRSPIALRNVFVVRLPTFRRSVNPLSEKQSRNMNSPRSQVRWDILSWDPPVEGMSRKDFSLNDVLFKVHTSLKSKSRYPVLLPQTRHKHTSSSAVPLGPKVNLPSGLTKSGSSSGRSKVDDLPSWRRATVTPSAPETGQEAVDTDALDTISCSPPPTPEAVTAQSVLSSVNKVEAVVQRTRAQPKMPEGTAVAFYREPPSEAVGKDSKGTVTFTVVSELDVLSSSLQSDPPSVLFSSPVESLGKTSPIKEALVPGSRVVNGLGKDTSSPRLVVSTQLDSKSSDELADRSLVTPGSASYSTPWTKSPLSFASAKESPARAPDPEHLKAVWSQPSDKALVPAVNSLEGIADDLTALPFTLQDVKSEDGETPPPTSASNIPSKMSLHDVTRAFQQVPTSSNTVVRSTSALPSSSASGPISRPSSYAYNPVHPPVRPPYPYSPIQSSSPTLVYPTVPSPSPRVPVNGHSPMFSGGQPIWVPLQPSQNHSGAVRGVPSPYPAQLMAYPSPNGVPSMYGPPPLPHGAQSSQVNGAAQSRPRNMPMMSPVMHSASPSHANHSMYAGSPVMMHALPMIGQPYITVPAGRGQGRPDGMPGMQQSHPVSQPSHPLYGPAQPLPYARPSW